MPKPDTKALIFAAAESEFLRRGYDGARMQAIADRAGINKAMLHYHFRTKEELFGQIFHAKAKLLFPRVQASLRDHDDFIAFACAFVDIYLAHLIEHPDLPFYVLQVSATNADLFKQLSADLPARLVAALETAVREGRVRPLEPIQFLWSLFAMCVMPFIGRDMLKHLFELDERAFQAVLQRRGAELKRYIVLMLTPEPRRARRVRKP